MDENYAKWRQMELDISDAMRQLGVVDNDAAKKNGLKNSIWAQRDRALGWLDRSHCPLAPWCSDRDQARVAYLRTMSLSLGGNGRGSQTTAGKTIVAAEEARGRHPRHPSRPDACAA